MNLCIVVNSFPVISETFIINKVFALADAGNKVTVLRLNSTGDSSLIQLYKFNQHKNISIVNTQLPKTVLETMIYGFRHPIQFTQCISNHPKKMYANIKAHFFLNFFNNSNFDIIHFEFSGLAISFLEILQQLKPVTVLSCRGSAEKVKTLTEPDRAKKLAEAFKHIDAIHCVSEDMKQTIAPFCADLSKVFVNRPAIDALFFTPNKTASWFEGISVLSIGRFSFQKGYLIGILAIKKLVDKGYNIRWNIIGDGPMWEELVFHIHTLQLQNHIVLLGKKNKHEVNEWINKSDIFLLTSVYEGIPNVVLEAMAMELPVVTTKSGGVDEVINHSKDGFIAPLYAVDEIAELLEQFINNPNLALQMGVAARKKILAEYTIQRQLQIFQSNYQHLLEKNSISK